MITVVFVDDGQDFLEWDVNDNGKVIDCSPFQGEIWIGTIVHNKDIHPGDYLDITTPDGVRRRLDHAVEEVKEIA
jgi:hypothetical protein